MLKALTIRDFAIIREVRLEFATGLTVITGETGAGKSMVFDVCALLAGARADVGVIRAGAERAELCAEFDVTALKSAKAWLATAEMNDDNNLTIRRVIREGNSKAWINGHNATAAQLRELASYLLELHGQHESQDLLDPANQLAILDGFAGHDATVNAVQTASSELKQLKSKLKALQDSAGTSGELIELLRAQYLELKPLKLASEHLNELDRQQKRLSNVEALQQAAAEAHHAIDGSQATSVLRQLHQVQRNLSKHSAVEQKIANADALLESVINELTECASVLADLNDELNNNTDTSQLQRVESELNKLHDLARKHRVMVQQLHDRRLELAERLSSFDGAEVELANLQKLYAAADQRWQEAALVLGQKRIQAAKKLSQSVQKLITELGMAGGRFEMQFVARASHERHDSGAEIGEFWVSANPGQPPRSLRKVASGGELSRYSLALKVASFGKASVPVLLFDEIDAGIGGAVADTVGRLLAKLANSHQVVVVTHLAQVAAYGDQHFQVSKNLQAGVTESQALLLDQPQRVQELARMLTGTVNAPSLSSAQDLIARALSAKGRP